MSESSTETARTRSTARPEWKNVTLFLLTICIVVLCWLLTYPFLSAIVGAVTLAVVTYKPYLWIELRCRNRTLSATAAVLVVVVSIITPLFFIGVEIVKQALGAANMLRSGIPQQKFEAFLSHHSVLAARVQSVANQFDIEQASQKAASYAASNLGGLLGNSFGAITQLVLMIFILFFLYRDRDLAIASLRSILPLSTPETDLMLKRSGDTIYATASGRLVVSVVQGILAGLAFWALGIEGAMLWGFTTVIAAMVPLVGAFFVWGPIAAFLALTGHWIQALILVIWGGVIVSSIDNYLYPVLVGSRLQQHTVAVLISVLGGVTLFGISGIILGPVLLAICKTLLEIWSDRTSSAAS